MYIEFPQYIRSGKNVDKQQKIVNNTSQYPFAKAGGYLTDSYELSCDDSRFCHFWLNTFGFRLQIYHNSLTFASGFGQNLSGTATKRRCERMLVVLFRVRSERRSRANRFFFRVFAWKRYLYLSFGDSRYSKNLPDREVKYINRVFVYEFSCLFG